MRKILCGIAALALTLCIQAGTVRAEAIPLTSGSLGNAEIAAMQGKINSLKAAVAELEAQVTTRRMLKQALDILAALIPQVRAKLANPSTARQERVVLGSGLAGLKSRLLAVNETLHTPVSRALAAAPAVPQRGAQVQPSVVASQDVIQKPEAAKQPEVPATVAVNEEQTPTEKVAEQKEAQTASIAGKGNWYGPVGILLIAVGFIAFFLWRGKKEEKREVMLPQV